MADIAMEDPVETMDAVQISGYCSDFAKVDIKNIPIPTPGPNEALIKVCACAINAADWQMIEGQLTSWKPYINSHFPFKPGIDFAGIIVDIGPPNDSPDEFNIGEEVMGANWLDKSGTCAGAFAEYIVVSLSKLSRKPIKLSFPLAAGIPLVGLTAFQGIHDHLKVQPGDRVLVIGGSTAVGQIAIQLALSETKQVYATCSKRCKQFVHDLGAEPIVYDDGEDFTDGKFVGGGFHKILDTVGLSEDYEKACNKGALLNGGSFASVANGDIEFDPRYYNFSFSVRTDAPTVELLANMVAAGDLKLATNKQWRGLSRKNVQEALDAQRSWKSVGKNVIRLA